MNTKLQVIGNLVCHALPSILRLIEIERSTRLGAPAVQVTFPPSEIQSLLHFLKRSSLVQAKALLDLWVVDYPSRHSRFEIKYNLLSFRFLLRVLLRSNVGENKALKTADKIYKSAGWLEREAFDLYGVFFIGNGDLRRLLTDYGFAGYPMRKDFPLSGYLEVRYDDN